MPRCVHLARASKTGNCGTPFRFGNLRMPLLLSYDHKLLQVDRQINSTDGSSPTGHSSRRRANIPIGHSSRSGESKNELRIGVCVYVRATHAHAIHDAQIARDLGRDPLRELGPGSASPVPFRESMLAI